MHMCSIALLILRTSFSHFDIYELLELPDSQQSVRWGLVFAHVSLRLALTQCHQLFTVSFAVYLVPDVSDVCALHFIAILEKFHGGLSQRQSKLHVDKPQKQQRGVTSGVSMRMAVSGSQEKSENRECTKERLD